MTANAKYKQMFSRPGRRKRIVFDASTCGGFSSVEVSLAGPGDVEAITSGGPGTVVCSGKLHEGVAATEAVRLTTWSSMRGARDAAIQGALVALTLLAETAE